ncbi:MAG: ABC-three component system protein [Acidobacteriota bacterium]
MKYAYEDLSEGQFETLVVLVCQNLLGIAVQGFAKGPDGGRDAKFVGTAELHPSKAAPWVGITIVQAKHTNGFNRSFSETDFFSEDSESTVIAKEIPRITKLRSDTGLDHYMLFSNRRLTGNAETDIRAHISTQCSLPLESIYLCGLEQLDLWLKRFPTVASLADLDPVDSPLIVSSDDLCEVVEALARQKSGLSAALDNPPTPRVSYETKNRINKMTAEYAKELRKRYLKETAVIAKFLSAPENKDLLERYESAVEEFQLKIIAKRKDYQSFDEVMEYLLDLLFARDAVLKQQRHKRLTRAMLFYMYWHCDIGEDDDVTAN